MLASTPYNRHRSARLDAQKGYADTPTIRNARSLLFPFHSPGANHTGRATDIKPTVIDRQGRCRLWAKRRLNASQLFDHLVGVRTLCVPKT
jgi:hypothetical protein